MPVAIIYAANSKSVRRILVDDEEARLTAHVESGEGIILVGEKVDAPRIIRTKQNDDAELFFVHANGQGFPDLNRANEIVEELTGVKPAEARCVVLGDDLRVVDVIMADPSLDGHKDGFVIREPEAVVGDKLQDSGEFQREVEKGVFLPLDRAAKYEQERSAAEFGKAELEVRK